MSASRLLGLPLLVLLAGGCHSFTVTNSGRTPAAEAAPGYDNHMHSAIIGDVVIIDKPAPLAVMCPGGWATIDREVTAFNGLINMIGGGIYQADSLTVHCTKGARPPAPAAPPPATGTPTQPPGTPTLPPLEPPSSPPPGVSL
jgi:hypothetical protein